MAQDLVKCNSSEYIPLQKEGDTKFVLFCSHFKNSRTNSWNIEISAYQQHTIQKRRTIRESIYTQHYCSSLSFETQMVSQALHELFFRRPVWLGWRTTQWERKQQWRVWHSKYLPRISETVLGAGYLFPKKEKKHTYMSSLLSRLPTVPWALHDSFFIVLKMLCIPRIGKFIRVVRIHWICVFKICSQLSWMYDTKNK